MYYNFMSKSDSRTTMTIRRNGTFKTNPRTELHNNHIYSGEDNYISMANTYSVDFECKFNMLDYPFDIETCAIEFTLGVLHIDMNMISAFHIFHDE